MKLNFSVNLTSADASARTISGRIVTFGEKGNTSVGPTVFASDSLKFNKTTKLLLEHDRTRPIGKLLTYSIHDEGIDATFRVAGTIAGDDSLLEASEGLRDGFSVGAFIEDYEIVKGVMNIKAARIQEVSLVTEPAIDSARVAEVAASEEEKNSETQVSENTEGEQVSDTTVPAPTEDVAVEAAKVEPTIIASAPVAVTKLRSPIVSASTYLEHSVRAALGDDTSRQYVMAASDTDTADVAGLVPTRQLGTIINGLSTSVRPTIDAVSSGVLPDAGMTFEIPRVTAVPTVAETAEKGAFSDTQMTVDYKTLTIKKFAGMQKFDVEVLDRTSPAFFDELVRLMADAYAKATDSAMVAALQADGVLDSTTTTLPWDGTELASFIGRAAKNIYEQTKKFPTAVIVSPTQWSNLIGLTDSSNRPILIANNPQNSAGSVSAQSLRGSILGLDLYVDPYLSGEGDKSIIVVNRDTYRWYESPQLQLRTNIVSTGQVEVGYYGYGCAATLEDYGAFLFNKA